LELTNRWKWGWPPEL